MGQLYHSCIASPKPFKMRLLIKFAINSSHQHKGRQHCSLQGSVLPVFWILWKRLANLTMPRASVVPPQIVIERGNCARHRALAGVVNRQLCLQTISKPNSSRHRVTGTNEEYCYSEAKIRRSESKCPNFRGIEIWQRLQTIENSDGPSSSVVWG